MASPMSLAGKRIVVTGASSGIGRATVVLCANLGARMVLIGRDNERLQNIIAGLSGEGHISLFQDFSQEKDYGDLFDQMLVNGEKLDGMVHCAGIPYIMPLKSLTRERLHSIMNVNFYSFVELSRQFTKRKYSNDCASIVGISAALVNHPRAYELGYIASKAAIEAATKVIALECGSRGIRANSVSPGSVKTEMIERVIKEQHNEAQMQVAVDRAIFGWLQPEEIAKVCAFLLSNDSSAITAKVIEVDGGYI